MKAILTWHSIDNSGSVISATASELARQLDTLVSARVKILPLGQILGADDGADCISLTFDDGFGNFAEVALPLLTAREMPSTVFVVAGRAGATNSWDDGNALGIPSLPLMTWDVIREIAGPLVEIGAHGLSHMDLAGIGPRKLDEEVEQCAAAIEAEIGGAPSSFAFPYGSTDSRSVERVSRVFPRACGTRFALVQKGDSPHDLPRIDTYYLRDPARLGSFGSLEFSRWVALRRTARGIRHSLTGIIGL